MIVRLREVMAAYRKRTGERMTYEILAKHTGLSRATLESIGTRPNYNASLHTIARICSALGCSVGDLLTIDEASSRRRRARP